MKMQKSLILALGAGAAVSSVAMASEVPALPIGPKVNLGGTFGDRVVVPVYNAIYDECPSSPFAIGNGASYVMEDTSFDPGPWGATYGGTRDVVQVDHMFQTAGWTGTANYPETSTPTFNIDHTFEWYEPGSFTAAPMLSNVTPIATRVVPTDFGSGYAWNYTSAAFTTPVSLGTRVNVWVAVKATDPNTGNRMSDGNTGLVQPTGQTAVNYGMWLGRVGNPCVGSSDPDYGREQSPATLTGTPGEFNGGSTWIVGNSPGNPNDRRRTAADFTAGARVLTLGMRGDVTVPAPTTSFTLCNLADGATVQAVTVPNAGVTWGQVCTAGAVTDDLLRYLNIDTEGSATDLAIAFYDNAGGLLASDEDSGDGTNAQLSFCLGRAAAVGAGAQYDGRDGQLTAAGTFYVAIAPAGSSFGGAFVVVPGATGGAGTVNFATNVNAGGSLPTAVEPVINHLDFTTLGPAWTFPAADTIQGTTGSGNPEPNGDDSAAVLWSKFAIDAPGADTGHYLDIDFGASDYQDNIAYIFDATGGLVSYADDQVPPSNLLPALSFGATAPGRNTANGQTRGVNNTVAYAFAGQNGTLAAGTYFLAYAAWPSDVMTGQGGNPPTFGSDRRWHVRGLSGNNIGHTADFYTGTGIGCDGVDFNNDGLFPDTLDIDDFLSVFAGGPCSNDPLCGDVDFNNDGLFPDTLDIDALLSVFSGGPCLF